jgi:hypothetical protein
VTLAGWYAELLSQAADLETVFEAGRGTVIACGQHPSISHENGTNAPPDTGGTFRYEFRNIHEILIP